MLNVVIIETKVNVKSPAYAKILFSAYLKKSIDFFKEVLKIMDQCTHVVRAAHWENIIQSCNQRPVGQSVKRWLKENDVLEQSYYYWQRKLRNKAYDQIKESSLPSAQSTNNEVSFAEITMPVYQAPTKDCSSDDIKPATVIKTATVSIIINKGF